MELHDGDYQRTLSSKKMQCMRGSGSQGAVGIWSRNTLRSLEAGLAQCRDWLDSTKQNSDEQGEMEGWRRRSRTCLCSRSGTARPRPCGCCQMLAWWRLSFAAVAGTPTARVKVVAGGELAAHNTGLTALVPERVLLRCETARRDCKGDCNTSWSDCKKLQRWQSGLW